MPASDNEQIASAITHDPHDLINGLYSFTYLPIYYFQNRKLLFSAPDQTITFSPSSSFLQSFSACPYLVFYQLTPSGALIGGVTDAAHDGFYLLGPCCDIPYDHAAMSSLQKLFSVPESEVRHFQTFLKMIPRKTLQEFLAQLRFIGQLVNGTADMPHDVDLSADTLQQINLKMEHSFIETHINDKEDLYENNSLDIETQVLGLVETGDMQGLTQFIQSAFHVDAGIIADTSLRNLKNTTIVSIALACRAAIRGGLSSDLAFHLSDSYIRQMEALNSMEAIQALSGKMIMDYTSRVAAAGSTLHGDPILQKAIRYVQHNTNQHITVSDVAKHVGLSRGYLSSFFKSSLGFDLSSFIRRCKLEESKDLLRYSDRSIAQISSYLCFSSQSHFQNCFKKQYKITPQQYRRGDEEKYSH